MVEIKPGRELDRAVAEAIGDEPGLPFSIARADRGEEGFSYKPYSTDLNAAFAAAEKVGLFDSSPDAPEVHLAKNIDGEWEVLTGEVGYVGMMNGSVICGQMGYVSRQPTPAIAICEAILKENGSDC